MTQVFVAVIIGASFLGLPAPTDPGPTPAQLGAVLRRAEQIRELHISDEDEQRVGEAVSEKIRRRYGVVQDRAVHRYVSLVGTILGAASSRPKLSYRFIVLDTDGVNAFAAPGGYLHVTRGAFALLQNEAELAGVLAHEVIHVTEKHTMKALQKNKAIQMGAGETLSGNAAVFTQFVDKTFELVYAGFGRGEELEADAKGVVLADKAGYAPTGLSAFLQRLTERNKSATQQQGLFASHPEMQERIDKLARQIAADKLTASSVLADRYKQFIAYAPKPQTDVAVAPEGAAGLAAGSPGRATAAKDADQAATKPPADDKGKRGFGLSKLLSPGGGGKKSSEVTGSGASRGVDTERTAVGGAVSTPVVVTLTAGDIAAFKKEGQLK